MEIEIINQVLIPDLVLPVLNYTREEDGTYTIVKVVQ